MHIKSIQSQLGKEILDTMANNTYGITYKAGEFLQQSNIDFSFKLYPNPALAKTTKYTPTMFQYENKYKNMERRDPNDFTISILSGIHGESDDDMHNDRNAFEQLRQFINNDPYRTFIFNDTPYQIFNDSTSKVAFAWEANTEYTILTNVLVFEQDETMVIVDKFETDILNNLIVNGTGINRQKFITGANPEDFFKQYTVIGDGPVKLRSVLLKGDHIDLTDKHSLAIIDDKDMSGFKNLVDNSDEFGKWTNTQLEFTTFIYNGTLSATMLNPIGGIVTTGGGKRTLSQMQIFVELGIDMHYGNEGTYQFKKDGGTYETFKPISVEFNLGKADDDNQTIGDSNSEAVAIAKLRTVTISMYDENLDFITDIYDDLIGDGDMNTLYFFNFKVREPFGFKTRRLLLIGGNVPLIRNSRTIVSFQFKDAVLNG
jgi:hypothetical protein